MSEIENILMEHSKNLTSLQEQVATLRRCIQQIFKDYEFLTPELKNMLEELSGVTTFASKLGGRVSALEDRTSPKKKRYSNKYD